MRSFLFFCLWIWLAASCAPKNLPTPETETPEDLPVRTLSFSAQSVAEDTATNDGSVSSTISITLTDAEFSSQGALTESTHYEVVGLPEGLDLSVTVQTDGSAVISFSGQADEHLEADSVTNVELSFLEAAFTSDSTAGSTEQLIFEILFFDNPSLSFSQQVVNETADNDGSVPETVVLTLTGDEFSQSTGAFVEGTHYALSGDTVPSGLVLSVVVDSATQATLLFTGNAQPDNASESISSLSIEFLAAAFDSGLEPNDGTGTQTLGVNFLDLPHALYNAGTTNGDFGGVAGADATCLAAKPAGLPHANVKAFLSVSGGGRTIATFPTDFGFSTSFEIEGPTGTKIADDWADLVDGTIDNSLLDAGVIPDTPSQDEYWWSGSKADGTVSIFTCNNWTDGTVGENGGRGIASSTGTTWINLNGTFCSLNIRIYLVCLAYD